MISTVSEPPSMPSPPHPPTGRRPSWSGEASSQSVGGMITSTGTEVRKSSEEITNGSIQVPLKRAASSPSGMPIENTATSVSRPSCAEISIFGKINSETE